MSTIEQELMDAFEESMEQCFDDFDDHYEHETVSTYVPYGDTQVVAGEIPTERSQERCRESFNQDFDVFNFIDEYLVQNKKVIEAIKKYVAYNY